MANLDELDQVRNIKVYYRAKRLIVDITSLVGEVEVRISCVIETVAVENGDLVELRDEHGCFGKPDPKQMKKGKVDPLPLLEHSTLRTRVNKRKQETAGVKSGPMFVRFVEENEEDWYAKELSAKAECELFKTLNGHDGADAIHTEIEAIIPGDVATAVKTSPEEVLRQLKLLKTHPVTKYVDKATLTELTSTMNAAEAIIKGVDSPKVDGVLKNAFTRNVVTLLPLFFRKTDKKSGKVISHGGPALAEHLKEVQDKEKKNQPFTHEDLKPFVSFKFACSEATLDGYMALLNTLTKTKGAEPAQKVAKRLKDQRLRKHAQTNRRAAKKQENADGLEDEVDAMFN